MKFPNLLLFPVLAVLAALSLACGGGGGGGSTAKPSPTLAISPATTSLAYGTTQSFTATGANFGTAHWSILEAGGGTLSGSGSQVTYTAPNTTGTFHVVVKGDDPAVQASAEVKVYESLDYLSLVMTPHVMHVQLASSGSGIQGPRGQLFAQAQTVRGGAKSRGRKEALPPPPGEESASRAVSSSEDAPVLWTLLEGPVGGTVNPNTGEYTPSSQPGVYHLIATRKDDPKISGSIEVVVRAAAAPSIQGTGTDDPFAIYPDRSVMEPSAEAYLKVTTGTVTWNLLEGITAGTLLPTGGSDQEARYSAPPTPGAFTAIATSTTDSSKKAQAVLEVGRRVSVSVAPGLIQVAPNSSTPFTATVGNTPTTGVSWKVVEGANAGSLTGSGNTATYLAPATPGKYHVQATAIADPNRSGESLVEVIGTSTVSVQLLNPPTRVEAGTQTVLVASIFGNSNTGVAWGATGGTITTDGLWTAPLATGSYTVTATSSADPTKSAAVTIAVTSLPRFTSLPPTRININAPPPFTYSYTFSTVHPGSLPMTFSLEQAPAGASLVGNTISWTPTSAQGSLTNTFILKATDSAGGVARQQWTMDSILAQFMAFLSSDIWTFSEANTTGIVLVSPDGSYVQAQVEPTSPCCKAGVERGTTTIAGFDGNGFWHSPGVTTVDTNGESGLSNPLPCDRLRQNSGALEFGGCGGPWNPMVRMENNPTGIVGAWSLVQPLQQPLASRMALVFFFSNGKYLIVTTEGEGTCAVPGVEFGSYTYNVTTHQITASNNQYDTSGCYGFHHPGQNPLYTGILFTLSTDGKLGVVVEPDGTPPYTAYRISK